MVDSKIELAYNMKYVVVCTTLDVNFIQLTYGVFKDGKAI